MKRSIDVSRLLIALLVAAGAGCGSAPVHRHEPAVAAMSTGTGLGERRYVNVPDLQTASDFAVTFAGIICLAEDQYEKGPPPATSPPTSPAMLPAIRPRRTAMVLQGDPLNKPHVPLLGIEVHDLDRKSRRELIMSLRDLSGQTVRCDNVYCWARIRGVGIRIVGDGDADPNCEWCNQDYTVKEDPSFRDLVPKLRGLAPGSESLRAQVCQDYFPQEPVDGCVRIAGGELLAYPFKSFQQGRFVNQPPKQFADLVIWHGKTTGRAKVQIKSHATLDRFETVRMTDTGKPLRVAIVNLGDAHHTSRHFDLNKKLFYSRFDIPRIENDGVPICNPDHEICYTSIMSLMDIAGCSNSQYP